MRGCLPTGNVIAVVSFAGANTGNQVRPVPDHVSYRILLKAFFLQDKNIMTADPAHPLPDPINQLRMWRRFHVRLTVLYGGAVFLIVLLMGVVFYKVGFASEFENLQQRLLALATSIAETIDADRIADYPVDATEYSDYHSTLVKQFERVAQYDPDVDSVYILRPTDEPNKLRFFIDYVKSDEAGQPGELYDATDVPILLRGFSEPSVENKPYEDEFGLSVSGYAPLISRSGQTVGLVGIDVMMSRVALLKKRVLVASLIVSGIAAVLVSLASFVVARSIRNPLTLICQATEAVARGELGTQLKLQREDEFGVLGSHFDHMAKDLQERQLIRDTFGRYVSEEVARTLLQEGHAPQLGGEERVVTILFSDLRDYTTLSERLSPVQMVEMLNHYMDTMTGIVDRHQGCVIEFLGDAILTVFGAPDYYAEHAEHAVSCALEMREQLAVLNQEWEQSGLARLWQESGVSHIEARIGIHTGPVVAGNLGGQRRMKYAVIGDSVNVASRLESLNKELDTSILISDHVRSRLSPASVAKTRDCGIHTVKGRNQSVRVYAL
jgi:adenylate cyclase